MINIIFLIVGLLIGMGLDIGNVTRYIRYLIENLLNLKRTRKKIDWVYYSKSEGGMVETFAEVKKKLQQTAQSYDKRYGFTEDSVIKSIKEGKLTQFIYLTIDNKKLVVKNNLKK